MIVAERKIYSANCMDEFGTKMKDGRLTEPSNGKIHKFCYMVNGNRTVNIWKIIKGG